MYFVDKSQQHMRVPESMLVDKIDDSLVRLIHRFVVNLKPPPSCALEAISGTAALSRDLGDHSL